MLRLAARRLSSAAALPEKAPIIAFGTPGRYANALYASAAAKNQLLEVESDLNLLKTTLATSKTLHNFVTDPSIARDAKAKGMMALMDSANASQTTKNAMATIAEGGRLGDIYKVMSQFDTLMTAAKGEVKAVITSAEALPQDEVNQINTALRGMLVSAARRARPRAPRLLQPPPRVTAPPAHERPHPFPPPSPHPTPPPPTPSHRRSRARRNSR